MPDRNPTVNSNIQNKKLLDNIDFINKRLQQDYVDALKSIRAEINKIYEKYASGGLLSYNDMVKYSRMAKLEKQLVGIVNDLNKKLVGVIDKSRILQYQQGYYRYAYVIDQAAGFELKWPILRDEAITKAVEYPLYGEALQDITRLNIRRVQKTIVQGMIQGHGIQQISRNLVKVIGSNYKNAERIVRTELGRVTELGKQVEFKRARNMGISQKKILVSVLDRRTRPQSAQMDGQESDSRGMFKYPDGKWYIPHNTGHPEWDINDRETTILKVDGYDFPIRRTKEDGIIPYKSFEEWAGDKKLIRNVYGQKLFPKK